MAPGTRAWETISRPAGEGRALEAEAHPVAGPADLPGRGGERVDDVDIQVTQVGARHEEDRSGSGRRVRRRLCRPGHPCAGQVTSPDGCQDVSGAQGPAVHAAQPGGRVGGGRSEDGVRHHAAGERQVGPEAALRPGKAEPRAGGDAVGCAGRKGEPVVALRSEIGAAERYEAGLANEELRPAERRLDGGRARQARRRGGSPPPGPMRRPRRRPGCRGAPSRGAHDPGA